MILYEEVRRKVIEIGIKMINSRMTAGTWGNISAKVPGKDYMAITPSGVDYNEITPEGITIMDFNGNIIDGEKKPSIEFPMHSCIYKNREDIKAIVHTHSEYVTAFALARKSIPAAAEDMIQVVGGDVRVNEYFLPGSKELGQAVVKALEGRMAAVIANHGCLAAGRDLNEALKTAIIVEKAAKEVLFANMLGGVVELPKEDIDFMRDFYLNKYGQK